MEKPHLSLPHHVKILYDLIESGKFKEARDYIKFDKQNEKQSLDRISQITAWENLHYQRYCQEHPKRHEIHKDFNKSYARPEHSFLHNI